VPDNKFVNITFAKPTKKPGLYVGKTYGDNLLALRKLCKAAADQEKEVVVFVKYFPAKGDKDKAYGISVAIDEPGKGKGKPIDDDDDPEETEEVEEEPEEKPKVVKKVVKKKPVQESDDDPEDANPF
jgi:hypothetical protein